MSTVHSLSGCRRVGFASSATMVAMVGLAAGMPGCVSYHPLERGYADQDQTQVQFFTPPGATVQIKGLPSNIPESVLYGGSHSRSHEIATYGAFNNRLEQSPEEFSVFNLPACQRYEFKYVSAEGLPGVSVYGELDVKCVLSEKARIFQRRAFIPIALPSEHYQKVEVTGDEVYPYRGEAYRTAIDALDIERLRAGDVVEKVFFVADLKDAEEDVKHTEVDIAKLEREIEYADARFRYAYLDFRIDVTDPVANFFGTDKKFIEWEKKRQKLTQELDQLRDRLKRRQALLKADKVLIRKGMMVVATEEIVRAHRDPVPSSDHLGEVMLVMRIGGRHMHWGDPRREAAVPPQ